MKPKVSICERFSSLLLLYMAYSTWGLIAAACGAAVDERALPAPLAHSEAIPGEPSTGQETQEAAFPRFIGGLTLRDVDGKSHTLSDFLGKGVVVISFFTTWCEPCRKELQHLQALFKRHAGDGLMVIAVAMDTAETQGAVRPFAKQRGFTFPVLLDTELRATDQLNPKREAPFSVIIDRHQAIVWSRTGYVEGDEKAIEQAMQSALETDGE